VFPREARPERVSPELDLSNGPNKRVSWDISENRGFQQVGGSRGGRRLEARASRHDEREGRSWAKGLHGRDSESANSRDIGSHLTGSRDLGPLTGDGQGRHCQTPVRNRLSSNSHHQHDCIVSLVSFMQLSLSVLAESQSKVLTLFFLISKVDF
jgi:hypothetical protein